LVEFFGTIDRVFASSLTELEAAGFPAQSAQGLGTGRSIQLANEEIARAAAANIQLVALDDPAYPPRLRQIYDPPLVLYVRGNATALSLPGIAVVGTRHPTPYGTGMAERLACDLATRGLVIFSGLARVVDTAAHRSAVAGKGKTVAMFGTGVDVLYPKEDSRLSEQILANGGALVSEFPLGTFAAPQNFPIRNRIISGISYGVLVVEARVHRHPHHRALRAGAESRRLCRPRKRHQQKLLGPEHAHQTRRQAGRDLGRHLGGTAAGCSTCTHSANRR
jgi:DNA processing protein